VTCTPRDIAELATRLVAGPGTVDWRAGVGRAYYASYHAITPLAELVPGADDARGPQGQLAHRELPRRLKAWRKLPPAYARLRQFDARARLAAATLAAAIAEREQADYHLDAEYRQEAALLQIERMKDLLQFADDMQVELARLKLQVV
jgi:hypothetical protein